ncbi:hypothetical protein BC628DRAFT_1413418 [Trametes gibbosa]|uniref:C2H2-type domain-containing protein n=1 Tax=Trametes gibbosa TaxID=160864 RepID=A0A6G6FQD2_9APHY|nr:hypothetical protein BC628DRAFT_1413418 [Trametes gibbosa]QIE48427.1 hypothetical protein [Trametes gibbosa]
MSSFSQSALSLLTREQLKELCELVEQAKSNPVESQQPQPQFGHPSPALPQAPLLQAPGVDCFDADIDNQVASDLEGSWPPLADGDLDWERFLNLPQPDYDTPSSVYSDAPSIYTPSTLPTSPLSMVSDDTTVDSAGESSPKIADAVDPSGSAQLLDLTISVWYDCGSPIQDPFPVMYDKSLTSSFESQHPPAYHLAKPIWQPQQQHLSGAAASFAEGGMSMLVGSRTALLTPQTLPDVAKTTVEVVPLAVPTAPFTAVKRKRAVVTPGEKPSKRPRNQSTEKTLKCPECGSMWARSHNLRTHIKSVHKNERAHVCPESTCTRAFSRKHDLHRHYQSEHTDLPSPRNKASKM